MSKFEDNGGYYIDGVPYMDCKYTGTPVRNVSTDCKYVISDKALQAKMYKLFPLVQRIYFYFDFCLNIRVKVYFNFKSS